MTYITKRGAAVFSVLLMAGLLAVAPAAGALVPTAGVDATPGQAPLPTVPPPAGLPLGVPPAATETPATLPAPATSAWPFGETWSHTEGAGLLRNGADFWTDYVYDDHGAASPQALPVGSPSLVADLAPTQGSYAYPAGSADGNGADIFRTATGVDDAASYWRVDWNTLADPKIPIAEWVLDTDNNPKTGTSTWPAGAGITSPGIDEALVVSGTGARLINGSTGAVTDVSSDLTVDLNSRSFIVRIPQPVLPVSGDWKIRMAAGLADATGQSFAMPTSENLASLPLNAARAYNVTYRTNAQEPPIYTDDPTETATLATALGAALSTKQLDFLGLDGQTRLITGNFWNEDHQADALAKGDVSDFAETLDWSQLAAHANTSEPLPTGSSTRWYVSNLDLGQGAIPNSTSSPTDAAGDLRPNYLGRVQPYAVYVPTGVDTTKPTPLTWVLHSLGVNYNQYAAYDPTYLQQACQDRKNICATTEGFGPDGWYLDEAETDFWQVWRSLADTYSLDPERTTITGYSMGGWAAYKLGLAHPDLFRQALSLEGPPTCGEEVDSQVRVPAGPGRCTDDGVSVPLLGNARWLPYGITVGVIDELVPVTSSLETVKDLDALGYRYHEELYPTEDHLVYATQDRFQTLTAQLGSDPKTVNPGRVTYSWFPDLTRADLGIGTTTAYWVQNLAARTTTPGEVASVDATSAAIPDPAITVAKAGPTASTSGPTPALVTDQTWTLGAKPAAVQHLSLTLTDVSSLSVDTVRAGLTCATIDTTSDGPATLVLTSAGAPVTVAVPSGKSTANFCPAAAGNAAVAAPAKASKAVARKPKAAVKHRAAAVRPPASTLAFTGGDPALAVLALAGLALGAGALRLRRHRRR